MQLWHFKNAQKLLNPLVTLLDFKSKNQEKKFISQNQRKPGRLQQRSCELMSQHFTQSQRTLLHPLNTTGSQHCLAQKYLPSYCCCEPTWAKCSAEVAVWGGERGSHFTLEAGWKGLRFHWVISKLLRVKYCSGQVNEMVNFGINSKWGIECIGAGHFCWEEKTGCGREEGREGTTWVPINSICWMVLQIICKPGLFGWM